MRTHVGPVPRQRNIHIIAKWLSSIIIISADDRYVIGFKTVVPLVFD